MMMLNVELAKNLSIAMLTMLETLAGAEQAVFVLHQCSTPLIRT